MDFANAPGKRRPRVARREAADILACSRDNVRRLDRIGVLKTGKADRNGTITYDRREIEELARKRGQQVTDSGELVAHVFALFKAGRRFEDVCIETKQPPDVVQALWDRYRAGYDYGRKREETDEERAAREHEEQMREMDRELERRRSVVLADGADRGPGVAKSMPERPFDSSGPRRQTQ
jgi:hypothetical protein